MPTRVAAVLDCSIIENPGWLLQRACYQQASTPSLCQLLKCSKMKLALNIGLVQEETDWAGPFNLTYHRLSSVGCSDSSDDNGRLIKCGYLLMTWECRSIPWWFRAGWHIYIYCLHCCKIQCIILICSKIIWLSYVGMFIVGHPIQLSFWHKPASCHRQNTRSADEAPPPAEVKRDDGDTPTGKGSHHETRRGSRELPTFRPTNPWRLMSGPKRVITVIDEASVWQNVQ